MTQEEFFGLQSTRHTKTNFSWVTLSLTVQAIRSCETSRTNNQPTHRYLAEVLKIRRTPRLGKQLAWGKTEQEEEGIPVNFLK